MNIAPVEAGGETPVRVPGQERPAAGPGAHSGRWEVQKGEPKSPLLARVRGRDALGPRVATGAAEPLAKMQLR